MIEILIGIGLCIAIIILVQAIGIVSDGPFMNWTEHFKKQWHLSDFVAGETIQALGTSAPEIAISFIGLYILHDNPALGLATIIGSAIFQITVVIGIPLLFTKKSVKLDPRGLLRTSAIYGGSVILLWAFLSSGQALTGWELVILSAYHICYITILIATHKKSNFDLHLELSARERERERENKHWLEKILSIIPNPDDKFGLIKKIPVGFIITLIAIGVLTYTFVESSVTFAEMIGVSSTLIALTVLAGGSSIPELFSNIALAKENNIDQAIGNALGSNTLDICISFALVSIPYAFLNGNISGAETEKMTTSILFLFGYLFAILLLFAITKFRTHKWQGIILTLMFIAFVVVNIFMGV
ncbi:hypothetical protein CSB37_02200 [bacterium DOLZORAL124_38_8]|nr:MAG: hypothetical protein CSB37_02200 [bacterium DOLZORAL124_38_8]